LAAVAEHPRIHAWREAYRAFGARPGEYRSSIEALARRVLRGDALPSINTLVDIGNVITFDSLPLES
jgi:DNA/RNA-binding domain of Phe-tRNA-synthetase-like protein